MRYWGLSVSIYSILRHIVKNTMAQARLLFILPLLLAYFVRVRKKWRQY